MNPQNNGRPTPLPKQVSSTFALVIVICLTVIVVAGTARLLIWMF